MSQIKPGPHCGSVRIRAHKINFFAAFLEVEPSSRQCASGANGRYECGDLSCGLVPDFGARSRKVRAAIRGIVKLVRPEPAIFSSQSLGDAIIVAWIAVWLFGNCQHFGSEDLKKLYLLGR